jgi:hypothetical protein
MNANSVRHALSTRPDSVPPRAMRTPRTRVRGDDDDNPELILKPRHGQIPLRPREGHAGGSSGTTNPVS